MLYILPDLWKTDTDDHHRFVKTGSRPRYTGQKEWRPVKRIVWVLWRSCGKSFYDWPDNFIHLGRKEH